MLDPQRLSPLPFMFAQRLPRPLSCLLQGSCSAPAPPLLTLASQHVQVQDIKNCGFTAVWLPPPSDAVSDQVRQWKTSRSVTENEKSGKWA
eukprot:1133972-Pelagomonas_calceolata.AAC.7